jgi:hypothetical protein
VTDLSNERLAELISDAMDCTKWDAETWRVVNTVTDHDDHMSTEQALALGNLISRQSHSTGVVAWEGYWPGAGSIDSQTSLTRFKKTADEWQAGGAEVTPLYPHPKEAEVTVTEEMVERAADALERQFAAGGPDVSWDKAARAALVAALSRKG